MQAPAWVRILIVGLVLAVAACAEGDPVLMNLKSTTAGPDEFAILPNRGLEMPKDLADLPPPAPGAGNLADPKPKEQAVAALGGDPKRLAGGAVPAADRGLVAYAGRNGVRDGIREELAQADLEFRKRNRGLPLERWASVNVYYKAYRPFLLDSYGELDRLRRAGVRTVAAPPKPVPVEE